MAGWASTGLEGLDKILTGLEKGDNVVWQVDSGIVSSIFAVLWIPTFLGPLRTAENWCT